MENEKKMQNKMGDERRAMIYTIMRRVEDESDNRKKECIIILYCTNVLKVNSEFFTVQWMVHGIGALG